MKTNIRSGLYKNLLPNQIYKVKSNNNCNFFKNNYILEAGL